MPDFEPWSNEWTVCDGALLMAICGCIFGMAVYFVRYIL